MEKVTLKVSHEGVLWNGGDSNVLFLPLYPPKYLRRYFFTPICSGIGYKKVCVVCEVGYSRRRESCAQ